ncbi:hypothetical protein SRB5_66740 [Streptomyces sp. RB5]|uniref:Uncharacterized protein n=1 Tax=Streptomyces smaragdinus TaxID=2585196 RepID=A0A7K0CSL0_9ACTN|nr:hypothetical protein [Streptomyces smaragdinus]MQY16475.1 hypothetical protein [Streptomyces smaragdinus]
MSSEQPQSVTPTTDGVFGTPESEGKSNVAVAILVAVVAMLVGAAIYGGIMRATAKDNGEYTLISYAAIAVGLLVGLALGKLGGRNPALPIVAVVLTIIGAVLGQAFGYALMLSKWADVSVMEAITDHSSLLKDAFKEDFDAMVAVIYVIGAAAGFSVTKKMVG